MTVEVMVNGRNLSGNWGVAGVLRDAVKPEADIILVNGFPATEQTVLNSGDLVALIRRGEVPSYEEMAFLMQSRNSPVIFQRLSNRTVAVAGCGGLGSAVAVALARLFVKKLILIDFDVVEPSNLNRQQFFMDQIGQLKTEALAENLKRINPYLDVEKKSVRLTAENAKVLLGEADVVAECFDVPEAKALISQVTLGTLKKPLVAVSGIAGHENVDKLQARRIGSRMVLIGDGVSAASPGNGLMAPKVGVAAHLQAAAVMEFLMEMSDD